MRKHRLNLKDGRNIEITYKRTHGIDNTFILSDTEHRITRRVCRISCLTKLKNATYKDVTNQTG